MFIAVICLFSKSLQTPNRIHMRKHVEYTSQNTNITEIHKRKTLNATTLCISMGPLFAAKYKDESRCPEESWLEAFSAVDPKPTKNIINIGFNKGYNFALWTSLWSPKSLINVKTWYEALNSTGIDHCGICNDCRLRISPGTTNRSRQSVSAAINISGQSMTEIQQQEVPVGFVMVGVDLNEKNLDIVRNVLQYYRLRSSAPRQVSIHLIRAAASNATGEAWMPRCESGYERCALASPNASHTLTPSEFHAQYERVPTITVDSLVADLTTRGVLHTTNSSSSASGRRIRRPSLRIDVLHIDTEGHDEAVLRGAGKTLSSGTAVFIGQL